MNLKEIGITTVRLASKAKLDAIVCSPKEVKLVKKVFKKENYYTWYKDK